MACMARPGLRAGALGLGRCSRPGFQGCCSEPGGNLVGQGLPSGAAVLGALHDRDAGWRAGPPPPQPSHSWVKKLPGHGADLPADGFFGVRGSPAAGDALHPLTPKTPSATSLLRNSSEATMNDGSRAHPGPLSLPLSLSLHRVRDRARNAILRKRIRIIANLSRQARVVEGGYGDGGTRSHGRTMSGRR